MSYDILTALIGFAFVSSITPGPNNMMLLASGANFGLRRSVPHMLGISIGHSFMVTLVGLGLGGVFVAYPASYTAMKVASVAYMIWLAWKIAHAAAPKAAESQGKPFTFL
jgi:threonine/homoserine/homoserine lactone efflux protein